ncbi:MAG: response regulator, partial [Cyanobacteria bacterium P01_A01_bin.40]
MKILLVEDDEVIARTLENVLREQHYIVDCVAEGDLGWEFVETYSYDLILLDIILPKLNGIEFCKKLRLVGNQTPVLLLTAQQSNYKKVVGLDAGADDYVVKPFELSELLARIRVLLRRRTVPISPILEWSKLALNSSTHEVTYDDQELTLTPKEYRLLELFLNHSVREAYPKGNRVLTRDYISDRLWEVEEAPSNNTVSAHIKELRRKLKQAGANPDLIETVYGVGYRLKPLSNEADKNSESKTRNSLRQQTNQTLSSVWHKFEQKNSDRLTILERASHSWQQGSLDIKLLHQAQFAAHKLAGGLGMFGFHAGSDLAREMSELLMFKAASEIEQAGHFDELLQALRTALQPNPELTFQGLERARPKVIAIDRQPELLNCIIEEMTVAQVNFELVTKPTDFKQALTQPQLNVILWDLSLPDLSEADLTHLAEIINRPPALPLLLFTDHENSSDRFKIARLGQQLFVQPASLNAAQVNKIILTLKQSQEQVFQVLIVDDDPQVAKVIQTLLSPAKINLTSLKNPLDFWRVTIKTKPDLLILDVAMPDLNGIELCQLIRNDPRWCRLPILFFTIHHDLPTVQQILTAGGNDYISKTQTQSALVAKVLHHLDRSQILSSL